MGWVGVFASEETKKLREMQGMRGWYQDFWMCWGKAPGLVFSLTSSRAKIWDIATNLEMTSYAQPPWAETLKLRIMLVWREAILQTHKTGQYLNWEQSSDHFTQPFQDGDEVPNGKSIGKIPWRRKWPPTPVLLPGKSHGQRSLAGYIPWGRKELDTLSLSSINTNFCKHILEIIF